MSLEKGVFFDELLLLTIMVKHLFCSFFLLISFIKYAVFAQSCTDGAVRLVSCIASYNALLMNNRLLVLIMELLKCV